jgi:photosystem I P700 chlorophyll a apoprotein A1
MFSDKVIQLQPIFAQWIQSVHTLAPSAGSTAPNALAVASYSFGGSIASVHGTISMMPISLTTADFLVHHIHAFTIHVTALILLKGVLFSRSSRLIPDKVTLGFRFPCDGPGRGGTCQVSSWDHVFLGLFWMYNCISVVIFHFSWKMQSDVWGSLSVGKYHMSQEVILQMVLLQLTVGLGIIYGLKLHKLFNHTVLQARLMD